VLIRVHASSLSLNRAEFRRLHTLRLRPAKRHPRLGRAVGDAAAWLEADKHVGKVVLRMS